MIMKDGRQVFVVSLSKTETISVVNQKIDAVRDNLTDIEEMLESNAFGAAERYIDEQLTALSFAKMLISEMHADSTKL